MPLRNLLIVCPWASRAGGGLQSSVRDLAIELARSDVSVTCIANSDSYTDTDTALWTPLQPRLHPYIGPEALRFSPGLLRDVVTTEAEIVQLHGIWMFPSAAVRVRRLVKKTPLIISPHGMLDPWILSRGRAKKAVAKFVYETNNWRNASLFRALNVAEADAIRHVMPKANLVVIPNGIINPGEESVLSAMRERFSAGVRRVLFLGRLHEKKAVLETIAAWKLALGSRPSIDAKLIIAGWGDESYVERVRNACDGITVEFLGPTFGARKDALIRECTDFVLASHSEGLPMAVLEACVNGLVPVISDQCNLPALFERGIATRADPKVESIRLAFDELLSLDEVEREQRGIAAHKFASDGYSWSHVAALMREAHAQVVGD